MCTLSHGPACFDATERKEPRLAARRQLDWSGPISPGHHLWCPGYVTQVYEDCGLPSQVALRAGNDLVLENWLGISTQNASRPPRESATYRSSRGSYCIRDAKEQCLTHGPIYLYLWEIWRSLLKLHTFVIGDLSVHRLDAKDIDTYSVCEFRGAIFL